MDNKLNDTQTPSRTDNPQSSTSPSASNGTDFQNTAPSDALNQEAQNLSVETTGDPIVGKKETQADSSSMMWAFGVLLLVLIGAWIVIRLMQREETIQESAPAKAQTAKKTVTKTTKKPAPKKSAAKNRKKTTKKRR